MYCTVPGGCSTILPWAFRVYLGRFAHDVWEGHGTPHQNGHVTGEQFSPLLQNSENLQALQRSPNQNNTASLTKTATPQLKPIEAALSTEGKYVPVSKNHQAWLISGFNYV